MMKNKSPITYLCILSFIGFIYCISNDSLHCFLFMSSPLSIENMNDGLRIVLEQWEEQGFIYNEYSQNQLVKVYGARIAFDVLAMVGVGMMFYKLKLGWTFYWIFQLAYVLVPFFVLGASFTVSWPYVTGNAVIVFPLFLAMVHLVYVLLFFAQRKNLN